MLPAGLRCEGRVVKPRIITVTTVAAATLLALAAPAQAAGGSGWRLTYFTLRGGSMTISDVAASSASNAWAIGYGNLPSSPDIGLINRWHGTTWRPVKLSKQIAGFVVGPIGTSSASNVWAFGGGDETAFWNGHKWYAGTLPLAPDRRWAQVNATAVISRNEVWAMGYVRLSATREEPYVAEKGSHGWKISRLPQSVSSLNANVTEVSAVSGEDVWALLSSTTQNPSGLIHWNGKSWSLVRDSSATGTPDAIVALSPSSVWIQTARPVSETSSGIWHWNGRGWAALANPSGIDFGANTYVSGIASDGHSGLWVLGGGAGAITVPFGLWDYRNGQWTGPVSIPGPSSLTLGSLVNVPHSSALWAPGSAFTDFPASTNSEGVVAEYLP
jgi:hypothetical protein